MIKHQGGCHCGNIRFTTEYDPLFRGMCNCSRCRRLFGVLSAGAVFGKEELVVTGQCKEYTCPGGSGMPVHQFFCSECGTRVYSEAESFEGFKLVVLGVFDDPHQFGAKDRNNYKLQAIVDKR